MTTETARQIAAQCWTDDTTAHIEMNVDLAEAFAVRVDELLTDAEAEKAELRESVRQSALMADAANIKAVHWQDQCTELRARVAKLEGMVPSLPPMNDHMLAILGRPNFACHGVAESLRHKGVPIPPKSEAEQAAAIHFLMNHYLKHGADWQRHAEADLHSAAPKENS